MHFIIMPTLYAGRLIKNAQRATALPPFFLLLLLDAESEIFFLLRMSLPEQFIYAVIKEKLFLFCYFFPRST